MSDLSFVHLGLLAYDDAWAEQRRVHAQRVAGEIPDTVLLVQHPPVYTAGKRTASYERPTDGTPVIDVDRGGRITWHGPGQLVGYPIVRLPDPMDVVAYVRRLEDVLIRTCADFGVESDRIEGRSGVWIRPPASGDMDRKIAAIGVRVSQGVTMHGFALNCDCDLSAYDLIVACGIADAGATSLTVERGSPVTVADVLPYVEKHLSEVLASAR